MPVPPPSVVEVMRPGPHNLNNSWRELLERFYGLSAVSQDQILVQILMQVISYANTYNLKTRFESNHYTFPFL